MPSRKPWLILIGAAGLLLFVPRPPHAQQPPATSAESADDEDEKPTPIASLTVTPPKTVARA
jgi:hypothetical protein